MRSTACETTADLLMKLTEKGFTVTFIGSSLDAIQITVKRGDHEITRWIDRSAYAYGAIDMVAYELGRASRMIDDGFGYQG